MNNTDSHNAKPIVLSTVLILLTAVLFCCLMPTLSAFVGERFQKVNTEKVIKDPIAKGENSDEKEFSEDIIHKFYANNNITKFSNISDHISANSFNSNVPRVFLDIPVRPPKNHIS